MTPQTGSRCCVVDVLGGGTLHDPDVPLLHADDLAAVRGDGVFETMMLRDGAVRNVDRHLARFRRGAATLGLPAPDAGRWLEATDLAARTWGDGEAALRWVYSRGRESTGRPTGWITVLPVSDAVLRARREGVDAMTADRGYRIDLDERSPWVLIGAKTLSYAANMSALRHARERGFGDVVFLSDDGTVLEGPTSSVVVVRGRRMTTPPVGEGVLPGTTQAALFALAAGEGWEVDEEQLRVPDLLAADGVWLVSSVRGRARVRSLDGTVLPRPACADEVEALVDRAVLGG